MSGVDTTHPRFLRPIDVARIRRNQNRIQVQRVLRIARGLTFALLALVAGTWMVRRAQSDARFAIRAVEVGGIVHSPRVDIDRVTAAYVGANLFQVDIDAVQRDLRSLSWIDRIAIEKKLPDLLRIRVTERTPVALVVIGSEFRYVDEDGVAFAPLSPLVGNRDLPLVRGSSAPDDLKRCVTLLRELSRTDPEVYSRISEVKPVAPDAFELFDRELAAVVYANETGLPGKWRTLHAIARAEGLQRGSIEYADLRFSDRIVIKPRQGPALDEGAIHGTN
ncbi:MAG TPA: FtsQ-type POTRA domain-containing protein [Thermoanaerobaculia bacterium]|nr:FtsQ-type POTRA domain-containing protein [Thermoanaerobaculia bacterium]